jgi:hypothetical protein
MKRYRQKFLNHDLVVWQLEDGKWKVEIRGPKGVMRDKAYWTEAEAKWVIHVLAHWYLDNKSTCTCPKQPEWLDESDPQDPGREQHARNFQNDD